MARPPKIDDDQVLDRALSVFWRRGWSATSIRHLEAELDLKAPSIYRRFGSKHGLARAVLERYTDRIIGGRIRRYLTGQGDPVANLWAFIDSAFALPDDETTLLGCLLTVTALEHPAAGAELGDLLADGLDRIEAALVTEATRAERRGQLVDGVDGAEAGAHLALGFQGLMVLARSGRPPGELRHRAAALLAMITDPPFRPPH